MDPQDILSTLIFNQPKAHTAEGLARILGMVHLYRTSGIHFLAFFSVLEWSLLSLLGVFQVEVRVRRGMSLIACFLAIYWIWSLQAFRPALIRPIATFLIRIFFKNRGAIARVALPLVITFLIEWVAMQNPLLTPYALHYYLAVAGGLFAWEAAREKGVFFQHLYLALGSWLPIAAHDLVQDHLVSYATPLYSYLSLPVVSLFLYPLTLGSLLFAHQIPDWILHAWSYFLDLMWMMPENGITFASVSRIAVWTSGVFALVVAVWFEYRKDKSFKIEYAALFAVFLFTLRMGTGFLPSRPQVVQLDVGQGDSALLRESSRTEMIDLGGYRALKTEEWIRKLTKYQVTKIDGVLFSHLDEDHVGGIRHLLTLVPIGCVETNAALWRSEKGLHLSQQITLGSFMTAQLQHSCLRLVEPHWFQSHEKGANGNELMAGVVFELNPHAAYFALGDGDQDQEMQFQKIYQPQILEHPERYLKISHHGSKFSSGLGFLQTMHAKEFWISSGKHNHYHHPNPLTLLRLQAVGGSIHRTDVEGDLSSSAE